MSLPLSLGIVATDISQDDNEGAIEVSGVVGGKTKNASCSEHGDENASSSELGGLQLLGVRCPYMCWSYGTLGKDASTQTKLFSHYPRGGPNMDLRKGEVRMWEFSELCI